MTVFDRAHDMMIVQTLQPGVYKAATSGQAYVDTQGYKAATIFIISGTITDGTNYPFIINDSSDHTNFNPVTTSPPLINTNITMDGSTSMNAPGTVATITTVSQTFVQSTDGNSQRRFGYVGPNRYLRVDVGTVTGSPGTGGVFAAFVVLSEPDVKPAVQS